MLSLVSACGRDVAVLAPNESAATSAGSDTVPARVSDPRYAAFLPDTDLWAAGAAGDSTFLVGIKAPGTRRGIWKARVLLTPTARVAATQALGTGRGVTIVQRYDGFPMVRVRIANFPAFQALRRSPFVDYIEPATRPTVRRDPGNAGPVLDVRSGCSTPGLFDLSAASSTRTPRGDVVPWSYWYGYANVQNAWRRTRGRGVKVGIIDTGVDPDQTQFTTRFAISAPRTFQSWSVVGNGDPRDLCGHGTRIAAEIGAPDDGENMVGIAPESDIVVVRDANDVLAWSVDLFNAIWLLKVQGARVIEMALASDASIAVTDLIQSMYDSYPNDVVFVAASGTNQIAGIPEVMFPASLDAVIAVAGMDRDGSRGASSHWGPKLEFLGYEGTAAAGPTGMYGSGPFTIGGSSSGSAFVAGIATLVRSIHPTMSAREVRGRLRFSADHPYDRGWQTGFGRIDAYVAVGGFWALNIEGPSCRTVYDRRIDLTARTFGDGPFSYQWSTGATTPSITLYAAPAGQSVGVSVSVTDLISGEGRSRNHVITTLPRTDKRLTCYDAEPGTEPPADSGGDGGLDPCAHAIDPAACQAGMTRAWSRRGDAGALTGGGF
jgi:hypothetical protein